MKIHSFLTVFLIITSVHAADDFQTVAPKWELGAGVGMLSLAHYRGSDQRAEYAAPVPYFKYDGKRLKLDREGGRFFFYNTEDIKVDVSADFAFAVDSDDNSARTGMTDLSSVIELGPRIQFSLYQSDDKNTRLRLAIPLRTGYAIDVKRTKNIGWVFSPYFQLRNFNQGWESAISIGPNWASKQYHDYFYKVDTQYATVNRPAYNTREGYSGSTMTLSLSKRFDKWFFGLYARYDDLNDAVFIDSPLIKQKDSLMIGVAVSWVFKTSKNMATVN